MFVNISRLRALWVWLFVDARFAGLALGVIILVCVVALRPQTPVPVIRLTGLVPQVLGIGTVIWGISETREFFGHPSFVTKVKTWLGRFPLLRKNISLTAIGGSISLTGGKVRAVSTHGPGPNPTVEARLDSLEKNITLIHERIDSTQREMDEEFHKVGEALKSEGQAREAEDKVLHQKLEVTGTGGMHISAIGASWFFVGVILSTAGVEIAEFLK